jgi:hypothetical protein
MTEDETKQELTGMDRMNRIKKAVGLERLGLIVQICCLNSAFILFILSIPV